MSSPQETAFRPSRTLLGKTPSALVAALHGRWRRVLTASYYRWFFESIGAGSVLYGGSSIINSELISIGRNTLIRHGSRLEVVLHGQPWRPSMSIGNDVNIEQNVHIVCHDRVIIGDKVSIAPRCAIMDTTHPPGAALHGIKIGSVLDRRRSGVSIGENSLIGTGTTIMPNVSIGKNCLIAAGSLVINSIPDNSIAGGMPARVLRRLDALTDQLDGSESIG
jgi:acetyltransferase-like isoleucine patch superfamily enzyme